MSPSQALALQVVYPAALMQRRVPRPRRSSCTNSKAVSDAILKSAQSHNRKERRRKTSVVFDGCAHTWEMVKLPSWMDGAQIARAYHVVIPPRKLQLVDESNMSCADSDNRSTTGSEESATGSSILLDLQLDQGWDGDVSMRRKADPRDDVENGLRGDGSGSLADETLGFEGAEGVSCGFAV